MMELSGIEPEGRRLAGALGYHTTASSVLVESSGIEPEGRRLVDVSGQTSPRPHLFGGDAGNRTQGAALLKAPGQTSPHPHLFWCSRQESNLQDRVWPTGFQIRRVCRFRHGSAAKVGKGRSIPNALSLFALS